MYVVVDENEQIYVQISVVLKRQEALLLFLSAALIFTIVWQYFTECLNYLGFLYNKGDCSLSLCSGDNCTCTGRTKYIIAIRAINLAKLSFIGFQFFV